MGTATLLGSASTINTTMAKSRRLRRTQTCQRVQRAVTCSSGKSSDQVRSSRFIFLLAAHWYTSAELDPSDAGKSITVIAQMTGAAWGALSDEEKKPFEERAKADKERHAVEVCPTVQHILLGCT